jgi:hypothetical protein
MYAQVQKNTRVRACGRRPGGGGLLSNRLKALGLWPFTGYCMSRAKMRRESVSSEARAQNTGGKQNEADISTMRRWDEEDNY